MMTARKSQATSKNKSIPHWQKSKKSTKKWSVLESMKVLQSSGVDSKFFNDTIDEMNEIQTELEFA